jgi:cytidylate kinase
MKRDLARGGGGDGGRDIGTVVSDAQAKIYLDATPGARANAGGRGARTGTR